MRRMRSKKATCAPHRTFPGNLHVETIVLTMSPPFREVEIVQPKLI